MPKGPVTGKHLAVSVPAALGSHLVGYEYDLVPARYRLVKRRYERGFVPGVPREAHTMSSCAYKANPRARKQETNERRLANARSAICDLRSLGQGGTEGGRGGGQGKGQGL